MKKDKATMQNIPVSRIIKKRIFKASKHIKQITHHRENSGSPKTSAQQYVVLEAHGATATNMTQERYIELNKVLFTFEAKSHMGKHGSPYEIHTPMSPSYTYFLSRLV